MCGYTETYGLGKWYHEPCRTGTWLVVTAYQVRTPSEQRAGLPRERTRYFRIHDHMCEDAEQRGFAIKRLQEHKWEVQACFTLKRIYSYTQDARYSRNG